MLQPDSTVTTSSSIGLATPTLSVDLDRRRAAWQERGRVHDRRVRRRLSIAIPTVIVMATAAYMLLSR
jgi:hypothetical protein